VIRDLGLPPEKVTTVYNGVALRDGVEGGAARSIVEGLGVTGPYVLHVGGSLPRKNLPGAIEAVSRLRRSSGWRGSLVVVNGPPPVAGHPGWLRVLGPVSDADLAALYRCADALLYPSREEGFGLPPLEAMAMGTPVVVARSAALPEVCGPAALYAAWDRPEEFAAQLGRLLDDRALRERMVRLGLRRARRFTPRRMARDVLRVYRRLAGGDP
jgi:glycosyltransferase involved in cell wall biosynthesis